MTVDLGKDIYVAHGNKTHPIWEPCDFCKEVREAWEKAHCDCFCHPHLEPPYFSRRIIGTCKHCVQLVNEKNTV